MEYIIMGDPVPLARPRFSGTKVYDAQKHQKLAAGINLRNQHGDRPMFEGPLHIDVTFYMKIALVRNKSKLDDTYHYKKPDLSNLIKFIEDVGTGILYPDDKLIASCSCVKKYGVEPRIVFKVKELE